MSIQSDYRKQLRRVKQLVHRATKRGYKFPKNIIPRRPKDITTESVAQLSNLTPEELYKKAKYKDPITGKTVTGTEGRKIERSRASQKAAKTRQQVRQNLAKRTGTKIGKGSIPNASTIILTNVMDGLSILSKALDTITNWTPEAHWSESLTNAKRHDKNTVAKIFNSAINEFGKEEVARRLEKNAVTITSLIEEILYASGSKEGNFKDGKTQVNADINRVREIILGRSLTVEESIQQTEENEEQEFED